MYFDCNENNHDKSWAVVVYGKYIYELTEVAEIYVTQVWVVYCN